MARVVLENNEWAVKDNISFFNIDADSIDLTDGTWTLEDPDSLIQSVTFANGFNEVTWNALGAGSNNYKWTTGATIRAPRWYKLLKIDGNQITSEDCMTFQANGKVDDSVLDFNHQIIWGICSDPTSTTATTLDASGAAMTRTDTAAGVRHGIFAENAAGLNSANSGNVSMVSTSFRGKLMMLGGAAASLDSSGNTVRPISRTDTQPLASSTNQFLIVGVGTDTTTTITSGDKQKFAIKITVLTHDVSF